MELPLVPSDSSSLLSSLSSSIEQSKKFFSENSLNLETLAKQLTDYKQLDETQKYAVKLAELSKDTIDDIIKIAQPLTVDPLSLRKDQTVFSQPSAVNIDFNISGLQKLLNEDKQKAQEMIQNLVNLARQTKQEFMKEFMDKPVHPYEQMIQEYLGKNFKPKSVEEMTIEPDLEPLQFIAELAKLSKQLHESTMHKARLIVREALDTSFPGITSESLGTAFTKLSGDTFIINHELTKRHLEFVENIRAIPIDYIVAKPYEAARRVMSEFKRVNYSF